MRAIRHGCSPGGRPLWPTLRAPPHNWPLLTRRLPTVHASRAGFAEQGQWRAHGDSRGGGCRRQHHRDKFGWACRVGEAKISYQQESRRPVATGAMLITLANSPVIIASASFRRWSQYREAVSPTGTPP